MADNVSDATKTPGQESTPDASEQNIQTNAAQAEQTQKEPQSFDEAKYRAIAREEAAKAAQSFTDKASNRIQQKVQEQINALEMNKGVLGLNDAQVEAAKQKIVVEAMTAKPGEPAGNLNQSDAQAQQESAGLFVQQQTEAVFAEKGVKVDPSDPEFKEIEDSLKDPNGSLAKHLLIAASAAETKKARLELQANKANVRSPQGGGGSSADPNDISNITDSKELYKLGAQRAKK